MGATPALPGTPVAAPPVAPAEAATPPAAPINDPASSTGDPAKDAVKNVEHVVAVAPKLVKAPGAALDAATAGGDLTNSAQAVQYTGDNHTNAQAAAVVTQAHKDTHPGGIWGVLDDLGHNVEKIAKTNPLTDAKDILELPFTAMNAGMKDAQHQFRYLYDVYQRHGLGAALAESLPIMVASAAGLLLTPETGGASDVAVAAGEAAAEGAVEDAAGEAAAGAAEDAAEDTGEQVAKQSLLKRGFKAALNLHGNPRAVIPGFAAGFATDHIFYTDSWNRTANPQYKNKAGVLVNPGNILEGALGIHGPFGTMLSGTANGLFDLFTDPVNAGLSDVGGVKELAGGKLGKVYDRTFTAENLQKMYTGATTSEANGQFDPTGASLLRALDRIAGSDSGQLRREWPDFEGIISDQTDDDGNTIKGLASATNRDEVMERLLTSRRTGEAAGKNIPSISQAGAKMRDIRQAAANSSRVNYLHPILGGIRHPSQLFGNLGHLTERIPGTSFDPVTRTFKNQTADLVTGRGFNLLRQQFKMGMLEDQANSIIKLMENASVGVRQVIYRNAQLMTILGHAGHLPDDVDLESADWFNETKDKVLGTTTQTAVYNRLRSEGVSEKDAIEQSGMSATAARLMNKPKVREFLQRQFDMAQATTEDTSPDAAGQYAATRSGTGPKPFVDPESGMTHGGAVLKNQTGDVPIMDYSALHHMAQKISGGSTFTGSVDDFLMEHVTNPIFKRWILISGGYAVHVSLSEMALNWTRLGFDTMAKASYLNVVKRITDRAATDVSPEEMESFKSFVTRLVTGTGVEGTSRGRLAMQHLGAKLTAGTRAVAKLNLADEREMHKLALWRLFMPGGSGGIAPHGSTIDSLDDPVGQAAAGWKRMFERSAVKHGDKYRQWGPGDHEFKNAWAAHLGVTANDPHSVAAAQSIEKAYGSGATSDEAYEAGVKAAHESLKNMDPKERAAFMADTLKRVGDPDSYTPLESWAHVLTENVMAITHDGTATHDLIGAEHIRGTNPATTLLHRIATGSVTRPTDLEGVPTDLMPRSVPGRELVPTLASTPLQRLATLGYKRALNPIVDFLSRQPLAYAEFSDAYDKYEPLIAKGTMTEDEVAVLAASDAVKNSMKFVHNIQDRTVLDELAHNWVPFFFAQEQAYRRAGRLLAEDPGAFRRYMLEIQSAHDIVSKQQDSEGNQYFALPGAGFLDHLTVGALGAVGVPTASVNPTGFGGTLSAANVVFPLADGVRPDISPVVTMAAQSMYSMFEEFGAKYKDFKPLTGAAAGAIFAGVGSENMQESILQQVIPNTTLFRAIETAQGNDTSFNSAMMMTMQSLAYQQNMALKKWNDDGRKGPMPDIIPPANATPLQLQTFIAKLKNQTRIVFMMRTILGAVSPVSADVTVNDFGLNQDLQNDINSTGSVTKGFNKFLLAHPEATPYTVAKSTTATGAQLPDTAGALNWIEGNSDLINSYQYGAMWLMPNVKNQAYSATAYYEEIANGLRLRDTPQQYLTALYTAAGDQVYYSALAEHENILSSVSKGSAAENAEYTRWDAYMQQLQKQQPIWWENYNSGQRQSNAQQSINQLTEIFDKGLAPKTQQSADVGNLLAAYQSAESQYVQAGQSEDYSTAQQQVTDQWQAYCDGLAQQEPQLASVISSVFRDALTYTNET